MEPIAIVTVLALLQYVLFAIQVGQMRVRHEIKAPAVAGNPDFERMFRIHQNTLELLVVFLPGLWLFGLYVSGLWGAAIGLLFILGRFVYRAAYLKDPAGRSAGFGLSFLATAVLLLGGFIGAIVAYF